MAHDFRPDYTNPVRLEAGGGRTTFEDSGDALQSMPSWSGTDYVRAAAGPYSTGKSYALQATQPAADDYAGDRTTTGELSADVAVRGAFQRADDKDWFHFHADAGQTLEFDYGSGPGLGTGGERSIFNSDGQKIADLGFEPLFVVRESGDYYLEMSSLGTLGAYTQTLHVMQDDYSSDDSGAGTLSPSSQVSGRFDYGGDVDRFQMDMVAGRVYKLSLSMADSGNVWPELTLLDTDGAFHSFQTYSVKSDTMTVSFLANTTGTYKIDVGPYYPDRSGKPYTLSAAAAEADDHGGTMASATALTLGATVTGVLQSAEDADMFRIALAANVTYTFTVPQNDGHLMFAQLSDASGGLLAMSGEARAFSYTPTVAATYYLTESPSYSYFTDDMPYAVTVSATADDYRADTGTRGKLSVGGSTKGELEAGGGDRDWFAVTLDAGPSYWFSLAGSKEGGGTLGTGGTVKLFDARGQLLATSDDSSNATSSVLQYQAAVKGLYYVEVASPGKAGTYTVKAQLAERDDYGNDVVHAGAIRDGVPVLGKLELNTDRDVFKLRVLQNASYELVLTPTTPSADWTAGAALGVSDAQGNAVDTRHLYLRDGDGKLHVQFDAARTADYYLTVSSSPSGVAGGYTLLAKAMEADDYLASALTSGVLDVGKPAHGVIGTAGDQDWFKVHLEAGGDYVFDLRGTQTGGGTLDTSNPTSAINLWTANGDSVGYSSPAVGEPRIFYRARATGDYFLDVHANSGLTGSYTVSETLTSGDASAPVLASSSLQSGAVNTPLQQKIALDYSEAVILGNGYTLKDANGVDLTETYHQSVWKVIGHTLTIDPHIFLKPGMSYTVSLPEGAVLDLAGNKAAAQSYTFTTLPAVTAGTAGNDYMVGAAKSLSLDGGAGLDTVYYDGTGSNLSISRDASGKVTVRDYWSGNAGDTLQNVERLLFTDHAVALDIDGVGGQVYRLYQAAFHRAPAASGAGFWMAAMDHGASLTSIADQFMHSPEYARLYGAPASDSDFVKQVFNNVLGRDPLPAGNAFWTGALHDGASRAQVLASISESTENVHHVAQIIGNGFGYTPYG